VLRRAATTKGGAMASARHALTMALGY